MHEPAVKSVPSDLYPVPLIWGMSLSLALSWKQPRYFQGDLRSLAGLRESQNAGRGRSRVMMAKWSRDCMIRGLMEERVERRGPKLLSIGKSSEVNEHDTKLCYRMRDFIDSHCSKRGTYLHHAENDTKSYQYKVSDHVEVMVPLHMRSGRILGNQLMTFMKARSELEMLGYMCRWIRKHERHQTWRWPELDRRTRSEDLH